MADRSRLVGLDVARCLALLGMIATHVLEGRTATGELTFAHELAGGRASALFAVLAGVTLALLSGGTEPVQGADRRRVAIGLAVRALLVAAIGLALGELETGLAIILTYYGVLFLLGLPFLALRARALAILAVAWVVAAPVVSHVVRPALPERRWESPHFGQLADPGQLLGELLLTGYYPAVPWVAYLLAGMALGRTDLRGRVLPGAIAVAGAGIAIVATTASRIATAYPEVRDTLFPESPGLSVREFLVLVSGSQHGTTPTDGPWQWLLIVSPHSATPFDLAQTIGSALFVVGACLFLVDLLPPAARTATAVVFGAGTMTLTLYSLHAVLRTPDVWPAEEPDTFVWHVLAVGAVGAVFVAVGRRGPLETLVGAPGRLLRRTARTPVEQGQ